MKKLVSPLTQHFSLILKNKNNKKVSETDSTEISDKFTVHTKQFHTVKKYHKADKGRKYKTKHASKIYKIIIIKQKRNKTLKEIFAVFQLILFSYISLLYKQ